MVEPKYRNLITHDTQSSYANINKLESTRKKYRSESATLGLQYHVYKHFNLVGFLFGGFFSGAIRKSDESTNIPCIWRDKGLDLFTEFKFNKIEKV